MDNSDQLHASGGTMLWKTPGGAHWNPMLEWGSGSLGSPLETLQNALYNSTIMSQYEQAACVHQCFGRIPGS